MRPKPDGLAGLREVLAGYADPRTDPEVAEQCGPLLARYNLFRAARSLGVAPWELERQPYEYMAYALAFEKLEAEVQEHLAEKAEARRR